MLGAVLEPGLVVRIGLLVPVLRRADVSHGVERPRDDLGLASAPGKLHGLLEQPEAGVEIAPTRRDADRDARVPRDVLVAEALADLDRPPTELDARVVVAVEPEPPCGLEYVGVLTLFGVALDEPGCSIFGLLGIA